MKFYVASRFTDKETVRQIHQLIRKKGHSLISDWTLHKPIKPYDQNKALATEYANEDVYGAKNCDVFIILNALEGGSGMYVELGAAISNHVEHGKPKIYCVGPHFAKNMMFFHSVVNRINSINEVTELK